MASFAIGFFPVESMFRQVISEVWRSALFSRLSFCLFVCFLSVSIMDLESLSRMVKDAFCLIAVNPWVVKDALRIFTVYFSR